MKGFLLAVAVVAGAVGSGSPAPAQLGSLEGAKIGLHLIPKPPWAGDCASNAPTALGCDGWNATSNLVTEGHAWIGYDAYVVVLDIAPRPGLGGAALGLAGDVGIFGWTLCADLDFPSPGWPYPGGSNTIVFSTETNCQRTVDPTDPQGEALAVLGSIYVYAYGPAWLAIVPRPDVPNPDLKVADCRAAETVVHEPIHAGVVGFGGTPGYQPCREYPEDPLARTRTTWGAIKRGRGF